MNSLHHIDPYLSPCDDPFYEDHEEELDLEEYQQAELENIFDDELYA